MVEVVELEEVEEELEVTVVEVVVVVGAVVVVVGTAHSGGLSRIEVARYSRPSSGSAMT